MLACVFLRGSSDPDVYSYAIVMGAPSTKFALNAAIRHEQRYSICSCHGWERVMDSLLDDT